MEGGAVPQEQSPPAKDAQTLAKERITKYFSQLTDGCGAPSTRPFCGSNPGSHAISLAQIFAERRAFKSFALTPSQIAVLAFKLAKADPGGDLLVSPPAAPLASSPSKTPAEVPYLDLTTLKKLLDEGQTSGSYTPLVRLIGTVCGDPELLNNSFWKNPMEIALDETDSGLDISSAQAAFALLEKAPENVRDVLASAFGRLTSSLRVAAPTFTSVYNLRVFQMILNSPQIYDPSLNNQLLGPFLICMTKLPTKSQDLLKKQFFEALNKEGFQAFLTLLHDFITLKYLEEADPDMFVPNRNLLVTSAVQVMGYLHEINQSKHFVKYTAFFSDTIDNSVSPKDDYINYKRGDGFAFCNYPFVLQTETKSQILQIESAVQQYVQRAESMNMMQFGVPVTPYLVLNIFRQNLIYSSLKSLEQYSARELKKELKVKFVGEEGVDEGGVQKEWFQLLVKKIFDPQFGMFIEDHETRTHWFNNKSQDFEEFELIGKLLGLAIYNGVILDLHFPFVIYKKLLGEKPTIDDLSQTHPSLAHGLKELLKYEKDDVEQAFELNFQIQFDNYGVMETYDLVENGADVPVTKANREGLIDYHPEYITKYVKYLSEDSVAEQFAAFAKGFRTVCDSDIMKMFTVEELELLICGSPNLDFHELEKTTAYDGGFDEDHPTVRMFWEVVHSLDLEQRKKLLFFTTGSDRAPIGGLGRLNLVLARHGPDSDRLPTSHTCFNHLLLPEYKSKDKLRENLLKAIENAEGFGML